MRFLPTLLSLLLFAPLAGCTFSVTTEGFSTAASVAESQPEEGGKADQKLATTGEQGHAAEPQEAPIDAPVDAPPPVAAPPAQTLDDLATSLEGFLGYDELLLYEIDGEVCYCIENRRGTEAECRARLDRRAEFAHRMSACVGRAVRHMELTPPPSIFTYVTCLEENMERSQSCLAEALQEHDAECFEDRRHVVAPCRRIFMSSVQECEGPLRQDPAGSAFLNEIDSQIIENECHTAP